MPYIFNMHLVIIGSRLGDHQVWNLQVCHGDSRVWILIKVDLFALLFWKVTHDVFLWFRSSVPTWKRKSVHEIKKNCSEHLLLSHYGAAEQHLNNAQVQQLPRTLPHKHASLSVPIKALSLDFKVLEEREKQKRWQFVQINSIFLPRKGPKMCRNHSSCIIQHL